MPITEFLFLKKTEQYLFNAQIVEQKAKAKQLKEKEKAERPRKLEERGGASAAKRVKIAPSGSEGGSACKIVAAFVDMSLSPAKMSFKEK